jgi:phosphatidylglycerophosphatase C
MKLILFDFDGTITNRDTLFSFTRISTGYIRYVPGVLILSPILALHKVGLLSSQKTKEIFLSFFFKGLNQNEFQNKCNEFCDRLLPKLVRKDAYQAIQTYRNSGDRIVIVSASPENWIIPWANREKIHVIGTKLSFIDKKFTGKINGINCNGAEKVRRIRIEFNLDEFSGVIAYGDSIGDNEMLQLAQEKFYKFFKL